jgi:hypothetical protein
METYTEAHWIIKRTLGIHDELEMIEKYLVEEPLKYQIASPNCAISGYILTVSQDAKTWGFEVNRALFADTTYYFTETEYKNICNKLDIPFDLFKKVEEE